MIEYVIPQSPDDRVLKKAVELLERDGIIIFPTDTNWVMCAQCHNKKAIEKLYRLKGEQRSHHFSILCDDLSMATDVAIISDYAFRFIRPLIPGSYTFILQAQHKTTKFLQASKTDKEVGIRFPPTLLTRALLKHYARPLLSTNLTAPMLGLEEGILPYGQLIDDQFGHAVDMIIDPGEYEFAGQSTVVSLLNDDAVLIREGAGPINF